MAKMLNIAGLHSQASRHYEALLNIVSDRNEKDG